MLALVRDSGGAEVEVPPTIHALLAARLDQLDPAERSVLERGSVEGRTFHRGAVAALADGDGSVDQRLVAGVGDPVVRVVGLCLGVGLHDVHDDRPRSWLQGLEILNQIGRLIGGQPERLLAVVEGNDVVSMARMEQPRAA